MNLARTFDFTTPEYMLKTTSEIRRSFYTVQKGPNDTYYLRDAKTNKALQSPMHVNRLKLHVDDRDFFARFKDFSLRRQFLRQLRRMKPLVVPLRP